MNRNIKSNRTRFLYGVTLGVAAIVTLVAQPAQAAVVTWDGGGTDDGWTRAENWSDDAVPSTANDYVVSTQSPRLCTAHTGASFLGRSLTISTGGKVFGNGTMRSDGGLILDGGTLQLNQPTSFYVQNAAGGYTGGGISVTNDSTISVPGTDNTGLRFGALTNGLKGDGSQATLYLTTNNTAPTRLNWAVQGSAAANTFAGIIDVDAKIRLMTNRGIAGGVNGPAAYGQATLNQHGDIWTDNVGSSLLFGAKTWNMLGGTIDSTALAGGGYRVGVAATTFNVQADTHLKGNANADAADKGLLIKGWDWATNSAGGTLTGNANLIIDSGSVAFRDLDTSAYRGALRFADVSSVKFDMRARPNVENNAGTYASTDVTLGGLISDGTAGIFTNSDTATTRMLTLKPSASADYTFRASLTGKIALVVDGSPTGRQTLSGNNTYTGGTTLTNGILVAGHANALGTTGTITVNGGTLAIADGVTFARPVTFTSGKIGGNGTFVGNVSNVGAAPGLSIGTLTVTGDVALAGDSVFEVLGIGNNDLLAVSGALAYGGTLTLRKENGSAFTSADLGSYDLFDFSSFSGNFSSIVLENNPGSLAASFTPSTGVLSIVPEPATVAFLALGAVMVLRRRRVR